MESGGRIGEGSSPALRVPPPPRAPRRDLSERGGEGGSGPRAGDWGIWRFAGGGEWEVETARRRGGENLGSLRPSVGIRGIGGFRKFRTRCGGRGRQGGSERGEDVVGGKTTRRREVVGQVVSETWELGLKRGARWGPESGGKQKVFARIWASFTSRKFSKFFTFSVTLNL